MPNTVAKGNHFQNYTRAYLEAVSYRVIVAKRASKFDNEVDFYGLWDIEATDVTGRKRYIQVTCNGDKPKLWYEQAREFPVREGDTKEVWIYKDRYTYDSGPLKGLSIPLIKHI